MAPALQVVGQGKDAFFTSASVCVEGYKLFLCVTLRSQGDMAAVGVSLHRQEGKQAGGDAPGLYVKYSLSYKQQAAGGGAGGSPPSAAGGSVAARTRSQTHKAAATTATTAARGDAGAEQAASPAQGRAGAAATGAGEGAGGSWRFRGVSEKHFVRGLGQGSDALFPGNPMFCSLSELEPFLVEGCLWVRASLLEVD